MKKAARLRFFAVPSFQPFFTAAQTEARASLAPSSPRHKSTLTYVGCTTTPNGGERRRIGDGEKRRRRLLVDGQRVRRLVSDGGRAADVERTGAGRVGDERVYRRLQHERERGNAQGGVQNDWRAGDTSKECDRPKSRRRRERNIKSAIEADIEQRKDLADGQLERSSYTDLDRLLLECLWLIFVDVAIRTAVCALAGLERKLLPFDAALCNDLPSKQHVRPNGNYCGGSGVNTGRLAVAAVTSSPSNAPSNAHSTQ